MVLHAVSAALEKFTTPEEYTHIDIAGVSVFNAGSDTLVPRYGTVFAAMDKVVFGIVDKQEPAWLDRYKEEIGAYSAFVAVEHSGVERLLVSEVSEAALRRFLEGVEGRADYPDKAGRYADAMDEDGVRELAWRVLRARKGEADGYSGLLIEQCEGLEELPATFVTLLEELHSQLYPPVGEDARGNNGAAAGP